VRRSLIVLFALTLLTIAPAGSQEMEPAALGIDPNALPETLEGWDDVRNGVYRDGRVFIAGQPDEDAFKRFRDLGVSVVVNLRPDEEMDNRDRVPFDENALLAELELEYIQIPLGGEKHPYTKEAVDRFAEILDSHPGPVLLHCTVAWRASYLWAAYLVLYQDFALEAALARGEAIAISPPPLEGLLGRDLTLTYQ
jgi:uncharacterized protein (TIGR01244 family)